MLLKSTVRFLELDWFDRVVAMQFRTHSPAKEQIDISKFEYLELVETLRHFHPDGNSPMEDQLKEAYSPCQLKADNDPLSYQYSQFNDFEIDQTATCSAVSSSTD